MTEGTHVPTAAEHRRSILSAAIAVVPQPAAAEDVISVAEKFLAWVHGEAPAKASKPKAAKPAAEPKPEPPKTEPPKQEAAPAVDVLGDAEGDGFLTEDEPAAAPAKKLTIEDVRAALLKLQKETDAYTARTVLAKNADGADTLGKIKAEKYQAVIDAAVKQGTTKIAPPAK